MNKFQSGVGVLLVITWVLFALIDMWFDVVTTSMFIKISISVFALFLMMLMLGFFFSKSEE